MKKLYGIMLLALVLGLFAGCASNKPVSMADAAFKITGNVATPSGWSDKQMRSMQAIDAEKENKEGAMESFTGVPLAILFDMVGVKSDATTATFVASDGYTADAPLADLAACETCIVAFQDDNAGFDMVLPGFAGKVNVRDVVEIKVQ